jgi:hypothetical protein
MNAHALKSTAFRDARFNRIDDWVRAACAALFVAALVMGIASNLQDPWRGIGWALTLTALAIRTFGWAVMKLIERRRPATTPNA